MINPILNPTSGQLAARSPLFPQILFQRGSQFLEETFSRAERFLKSHRERSECLKPQDLEKVASEGIREIVDHVLTVMRYAFPLDKILVVKIIPRQISPFPISREHLETILFQSIYLAQNAMKGKGGVLTIEAEERVMVFPSERRLYYLRVSDTGAPVSLNNALPEALKREDPLFVIRRIVNAYGGTLQVLATRTGNSIQIRFSSKNAGE